jgi:hypothetical protein
MLRKEDDRSKTPLTNKMQQ